MWFDKIFQQRNIFLFYIVKFSGCVTKATLEELQPWPKTSFFKWMDFQTLTGVGVEKMMTFVSGETKTSNENSTSECFFSFMWRTCGILYIASFIHYFLSICCLLQGWAAKNEDYAATRWNSSLYHGVSQTGQWQWNQQRQVSKRKESFCNEMHNLPPCHDLSTPINTNKIIQRDENHLLYLFLYNG